MKSKPAGIIGGGNFGISLAKIISAKTDVIIYSRRQQLVDEINQQHRYKEYELSERIVATTDLESLCVACDVIFPVTPSQFFHSMCTEISPYLTPRHFVIHGTKGFHVYNDSLDGDDLDIDQVKTMGQVILSETDVMRVGAICGPNLAKEILDELPTATVIASPYDEVIKVATELLSGPKFFVFNSYDMKGAEMAGALKNVIALASGIIGGRGLGKNAEAMLITRGLGEIIKMAAVVGVDYKAFLGTAGIGDLIATATSPLSRNYNCGQRIAKGDSLAEILSSSSESIEGLRSLKVAYAIIKKHKILAPIITIIYNIIYQNQDIDRSINYLMKYPVSKDVDFIS